MNAEAQPDPVAVVGATTWGTTLAIILARRGVPVRFLARTPEEALELRRAGENARRLPGHPFPSSLTVTAEPSEAIGGARAAVYAVPSNTLRENLVATVLHLDGAPLVVIAAKGLERDSSLRMSQVAREVLPARLHPHICVLSGPNLAREIADDRPASAVVASADQRVAQAAQAVLTSTTFRVYTNTDVVGVELSGALKNIIALGAGVSDGLELGDNAKAAFVTRGLAEITRLGVAAGADPLTFAGLAGLGDLIATCYSRLSRNRHVGEQIAQGRPLAEVLAGLGEVAEGVNTTSAAVAMAREMGVEMPITEVTYRVLFEGLDPRQAVAELLGRAPRPERTGI